MDERGISWLAGSLIAACRTERERERRGAGKAGRSQRL